MGQAAVCLIQPAALSAQQVAVWLFLTQVKTSLFFMKAILKFSAIALFFAASCHSKDTASVTDGNVQRPVAFCGPLNDSCLAKGRLAGYLSFPGNVAQQPSILLRLTVSNTGSDARRFCKLQTPFGSLPERFLEIRNERGEEVPYLGAKPGKTIPYSDENYSYLAPQTGISADIDLSKVYKFSAPGTYTIKYIGERASNICVQEPVSFIYK
ncbi:hypothetical protein FPZ43_18465 [Mucilaginibacter pallidiroseus]|uniref:Uncharacterized protein n=1 Tax=Mucilaginibacter pallidiroseus TaxID=2599295 RepID=A0A563U1S4_9SPHI|nr:hypothetical protein [Mucilaginibacter pallidiroseus]TWR24409.1 hypothetical protein FPZ43_18465 [Mucilaginibacter pallidiroseus]